MTAPTLLNLGSGTVAPSSWINIDRSPNVILDRFRPLKRLLFRLGLLSPVHMVEWPKNVTRLDITKKLPFPDQSVDGIYSSHTLEHLYLDDARTVLRECRRVLKQNAVLRLALPDAEGFARDLVDASNAGDPDAGWNFNKALCCVDERRPTLKRRLLSSLSSPPHRWQPTGGLVMNLLAEAGFTEITIRSYLQGDLPGLAQVEHREESLAEARA